MYPVATVASAYSLKPNARQATHACLDTSVDLAANTIDSTLVLADTTATAARAGLKRGTTQSLALADTTVTAARAGLKRGTTQSLALAGKAKAGGLAAAVGLKRAASSSVNQVPALSPTSGGQGRTSGGAHVMFVDPTKSTKDSL